MAHTPWVTYLGLLSATIMAEKEENTRNLPDQLPIKSDKTCYRNEYISEGRCCQRCAAGTHVSKSCTVDHGLSFCDPCKDGEDFTEDANGLEKCLTCRLCRDNDEIQVAPCTRVTNTKCQCKKGKYCIPNDNCDLSCTTCSRCSEGQLETFPCTPTANAVCEDSPVNNSTCTDSDATDQSSLTGSVVALSVLVGIFIVIIGILIFYIWRNKRKKEKKKEEDAERELLDDTSARSTSAVSAVRFSNRDRIILPQPENVPEVYSGGAERGNGQCDVLPAKMDDNDWYQVYLRLKKTLLPSKWKELMRLLGLAEIDIEAIGLDHKNNVCEQNYQMLLAWRKQEGRRATLDALNDALDGMRMGERRCPP